jgi:hypothetical protein
MGSLIVALPFYLIAGLALYHSFVERTFNGVDSVLSTKELRNFQQRIIEFLDNKLRAEKLLFSHPQT